MPRVMYDSTDPFDIPETASMVLVYVDGIYRWSQAGRDRFKYATQVTCSAVGAVSAHVGDVEVGCIWPPERAVPWVQQARRDGYDPTLYVNELNDWAPTREAFRRAGVREPHWLVANYNGVRAIPAGSVGRQYACPSDPPGKPRGPWHTAGHWDESWVLDVWPGVDNGGPGGGGGAGDDVLSDGQDKALFTVRDLTSELHATIVSGAKRDARLVEDLGFILSVLSGKIDEVVLNVDEDALAAALVARGLDGASVPEVKAALAEVLSRTSLGVGE